MNSYEGPIWIFILDTHQAQINSEQCTNMQVQEKWLDFRDWLIFILQLVLCLLPSDMLMALFL